MQGGLLEAWALTDGSPQAGLDAVQPLPQLKFESGDKVRSVAALGLEPALAVGCSSGSIRFVALAAKDSGPVGRGERPVHAMRVLPHTGKSVRECGERVG